MRCDDVREVLSARLDGEAEPAGANGALEADALDADAHVAGCPECRRWAAAAASLHRAIRVRPAEPVPDLSMTIMARVAPLTPARAWARWALLVVALTVLVLALPETLVAPQGSADAHSVRHAGITDLALAVGLAYAAWRPWAARGLLPMVGVLGTLMAVGAVIDIGFGTSGASAESHHILEIGGVVLLALLARPLPEERGPRRGSRTPVVDPPLTVAR